MLACRKGGLQPADGLHPQGRHRDRELGRVVLDCIEPVRIRTGVLEQPVARAQRAFKRVDARHMLGVERQRESIEKAATLGGRAVEQSVHGRYEPDDAQMVDKRCCRCDRLAIDAAFACDGRVLARRRLYASTQRRQAQCTFHVRRYCP